MVTAALLSLLALGRVTDLIALVIIGREITISALREWMAQIGASKSVAVNFRQAEDDLPDDRDPAAAVQRPVVRWHRRQRARHWMIYPAAVLTLWSMVYYMKLAWPQIRERSALVGEAHTQK